MTTAVAIHLHLYQPPRDNPWLGVVEREAGAAPWHDWNERIERECYRALVAARAPGPDGRIMAITNLLDRVSFDVGPTLLDWLEHHAPRTAQAILAADARNLARTGHGQALATPYHHVILPLASRRDKRTEVRWGIRDFTRRFGRAPEGMWLPETAVDHETLDVLAEEGIRFTLLAPHQVSAERADGGPVWIPTAAGRGIAVFPYHGPISHDVAFGPLIRDAALWHQRFSLAAGEGRGVVAVATDAETFGHHHRFGEMALAAVLDRLEADPALTVDSFAAILARHPSPPQGRLEAPSSWSCSHGIERWRADCGCRSASHTSQAWRTPLREALNGLRDDLQDRFAREVIRWHPDPWAARDDYDPVTDWSGDPELGALFEAQRHVLRMFTSCGWFFDDLAGIETLICLRSAVRALELSGDEGTRFAATFQKRLGMARSNDPAAGTGADLVQRRVRPRHPAAHAVAAGLRCLVGAAAAIPVRFGAFAVERAATDGIVLRERRTGLVHRLSVEVEHAGRIPIRMTVADASGRRSVLAPRDLPEAVRTLIRGTLSAMVARAVLDDAERTALDSGEAGLEVVLERAALRLLDLPPDRIPMDQLTTLIQLLGLTDRPVSFDLQTAWYRAVGAAGPAVRRALQAFAGPLGFDDQAGATAG